jgi:hypothetical protein
VVGLAPRREWDDVAFASVRVTDLLVLQGELVDGANQRECGTERRGQAR